MLRASPDAAHRDGDLDVRYVAAVRPDLLASVISQVERCGRAPAALIHGGDHSFSRDGIVVHPR
jgi:hypothetical protein